MVGFGYDSHRLSKNETFIIGTVNIPSDIGTIAHSDGDALLHSLCDALLGAAGLGDIGEHFPDTDEKFKNADSSLFVLEIIELIHKRKLHIINIDATILLEHPKLINYKAEIRKKIADLCKLPIEKVNIKAKTNEKMGYIGRSEGVAAYCICEIQPNK